MSEKQISSSAPALAAQQGGDPKVLCRDLFIGFFGVGIIGFGGVTPWVRRMLVEQRRWLTEEEFVNVLSICQILPGANVGNIAVTIGQRFAGWRGALAALFGLYLAPFFIVLGLAVFYTHYVQVPTVENTFRGISAAASGLIIATGLKIANPVCRNTHAVVIAVLGFIGISVLTLPLVWVVFGLAPISIGWLWLMGRKA